MCRIISYNGGWIHAVVSLMKLQMHLCSGRGFFPRFLFSIFKFCAFLNAMPNVAVINFTVGSAVSLRVPNYKLLLNQLRRLTSESHWNRGWIQVLTTDRDRSVIMQSWIVNYWKLELVVELGDNKHVVYNGPLFSVGVKAMQRWNCRRITDIVDWKLSL